MRSTSNGGGYFRTTIHTYIHTSVLRTGQIMSLSPPKKPMFQAKPASPTAGNEIHPSFSLSLSLFSQEGTEARQAPLSRICPFVRFVPFVSFVIIAQTTTTRGRTRTDCRVCCVWNRAAGQLGLSLSLPLLTLSYLCSMLCYVILLATCYI